MTALRGRRRRIVLTAILLVIAVFAALAYSQLRPLGELMPAAIAALESDATVRVSRDRWIVFEPTNRDATTGFIFYPGGRVLPAAYAPWVRALAEQGYLSVIVPMPLNLAIFNPDAANDVIAAFPAIQAWVIGGHSLGGVMAARFADSRRDQVDGLALLAAYPEAHIDLSESELAAAAIYGDRDGLVSVAEMETSLGQLPPEAQAVRIEGGNHAQFGWYGEQAGDQPARISRARQQSRVVAALLRALQEAGSRI